MELDEEDELSLIFHYPSSFPKKRDEYIQSVIKLEFGARGDVSPFESKKVTAYCQQLLPELYSEPPEIRVRTLLAKHIYWEKITLLHTEHDRSPEKPLPRRLFRHYYHVVMLDQKNLTQDAMHDIKLLNGKLSIKVIRMSFHFKP